jgi:hypothetical protein
MDVINLNVGANATEKEDLAAVIQIKGEGMDIKLAQIVRIVLAYIHVCLFHYAVPV